LTGEPTPTALPGADPAPAPQPIGRRRWVELAGFLTLLAAALAGAFVWGRPGPSSDAGPPFDVVRPAPSPAPPFALRDLEGRPARLEDYRGRVVLLNFWATWCAPCREEMPAIQALARELDRQGLVVLAVNYQEGEAAVREFARETAVSVPVLLDPDGAVTRRYRVTVLPTTVLIDRQGALVGTVLGFRDWAAPGARAYMRGLIRAAT